MECSCIANNNFDFVIEYKDTHLLFIDKSEWVTPQYSDKKTTHPLIIINQSKNKTFDIRINGTTKINYCDLPTNSICGPDGIYTFKIESCGEIFTRCEAIIQHVICSYSKLLISSSLEEYQTKVFPVFKEIEYIKASARICDVETTQAHYNILKDMLTQLNCKC